MAQTVAARLEAEREASRQSQARQRQIAKPTVSTLQCLSWTTNWLWTCQWKDVLILAPLLTYTSGWAVLETYIVTWMIGELKQTTASATDDMSDTLHAVALYGSSLLAGNFLEAHVEYQITTHTPLVKNAMKVEVTSHLARVPQEMLDHAKEASFRAVS